MTTAPSEATRPRVPKRADCRRLEPMVRRIACALAWRLDAAGSVEDLEGQGWIGLIEAFARTSAAMPEGELQAYLACRVRGAMLDYLRTLDPANREIRNAARRLARASDEDSEATRERYRQEILLLRARRSARVVRFDDLGEPPARLADSGQGERCVIGGRVARAIASLPPRLMEIVTLRYREDWNHREIARRLGVSAARVSQLHAEAIDRIRTGAGVAA
jgi:RNA polymerase sigma factor for flagellar operon FliA